MAQVELHRFISFNVWHGELDSENCVSPENTYQAEQYVSVGNEARQIVDHHQFRGSGPLNWISHPNPQFYTSIITEDIARLAALTLVVRALIYGRRASSRSTS